MSYHQILERFTKLHTKGIDLSLGRVHRLLSALNDPHKKLPPTIHIAGTNGKGSTTMLLRSALEAAGKRVHVYTSPHLISFRERIRVAGHLISEDMLESVLKEVESANNGGETTFFEATTIAAFLAFTATPADILLLEVGLGGRLDATNVIAKTDMSVITPVSMDHETFLGHRLGSIAYEKAGILKPQTPACIAPQQPEAREAIHAYAQKIHCPLITIDKETVASAPPTNLKGDHQKINSAVAATVLRTMNLVSEDHITSGFMKVDWPGRLHYISSGKLKERLPPTSDLWLDGAHNIDAGSALVRFLTQEIKRTPQRPLDIIIGMLQTKNIKDFLSLFVPLNPTVWSVDIPQNHQSLDKDVLQAHAHHLGLRGRACASLDHALETISQETTSPLVIITGSLYLVGHALWANGVKTLT